MTETAILVAPFHRTGEVGAVLSRDGVVPIRSKYVPEIRLSYFAVPLCLLSGLSWLFNERDVQIDVSATCETAMRWANADIKLRRVRQEIRRRRREERL